MITHTYRYKHTQTHSWIFNGIEMYLNMRSLVITWHYSFSRVLNNISEAGKPFVSTYQGFDWGKERKDSIFRFICGQHLNHTKPSNIMSFISHQSKIIERITTWHIKTIIRLSRFLEIYGLVVWNIWIR